ncbi:MAG: bifunctional oligoribonuclease/PAP phosphatase NrnA [Gemmatimonadota bacterium]
MSYRIPDVRRAPIRNVLEALKGASSVVLTTHMNADGDGVGCQAALQALLGQWGIEAWIVNPTTIPRNLRFLIRDASTVLDAGSEAANRRCQAADLCVVVDTGEVPRIGRVNPLVAGVPKVVIDHHPPGERPIEGIELRDQGAGAAGELVFDLVFAAEGEWSRAMVEGLYVALMTDTGSFRFSNSSPTIHRVAAELIERGVDPDVLHRQVYGAFPLRRFRLLQSALETLSVSDGGRVGWMSVPTEAYRELGCRPDDLEGMVDFPREVEGVEVAILFRELDDGSVKLSFRSNGAVDVNRLAREFGGGGHARASGAVIGERMEELLPRVVERTVELAGAESSDDRSPGPPGTGTPARA